MYNLYHMNCLVIFSYNILKRQIINCFSKKNWEQNTDAPGTAAARWAFKLGTIIIVNKFVKTKLFL